MANFFQNSKIKNFNSKFKNDFFFKIFHSPTPTPTPTYFLPSQNPNSPRVAAALAGDQP
jgi:hypothetical protein